MNIRRHLKTMLLSLTLAAVPLGASAQTDSPTDSADAPKSASEERATAFVGVEGANDESVPGYALMIAAYAFVWLILFFYVVRMARMQAATAGQIAQLEEKIRS